MDTLERLTARSFAARSLLAGAVGFTTADVVRRIVEPAHPTSVALADAAGRHTTEWLAAGLLSAATPFLLLPGLGILAATAQGRGARLVRAGAALLGVGSIAASVHAAGYFGMYDIYARARLGDATVRAVDAASESSPFFVPFIVLFMLGMLVGPLLLAAGLRRAGTVPVWGALAALVFVVAAGSGGVPAGLVGLISAGTFFGCVARVVGGRFGALQRPDSAGAVGLAARR